MFLFDCCMTGENHQRYKIKTTDKNHKPIYKFLDNIDDFYKEAEGGKTAQIVKVKQSSYDSLIKQYQSTNTKWIDTEFPPQPSSLGHIQGVNEANWKRISDMIKNPVLFDSKIEPRDVIQGNLGDCYFLSALAAISETPDLIRNVFGNQKFNPHGIYKVQLRIDGQIQEIVVDDFVPVNEKGMPLFCQPNKNEFWVLILEKAWAKAHVNYSNIVAGSPIEVFKAVTYAPAKVYLTKESKEESEKLWRVIHENALKNRPCCCGTSDSEDIYWAEANLLPGHAYSLIDAANLEHKNGNYHRVVKLRNPWGQTEWTGQASETDKEFWQNIHQSQEKTKFLRSMEVGNDGIFYMTYRDYRKYFSQTHISLLETNANYISEELYSNGKAGEVFTLEVKTQAYYTIEVHQSGLRGESETRQEEGLSRATIVVAKMVDDSYDFVDGLMQHHEEDASLKISCTPGKYVIYVKLEPTMNKQSLPQHASISVYSTELARLKREQRKMHPELLQKVFLSYSRLNKKKTHNDGMMWMSWKLLFQQGGFAYLAFGNSTESKQKYTITFNQKDFNEASFHLKKPYKRKPESQTIEVLPGKETIILARIDNKPMKSLRFPPHIDLTLNKIE